MSTGKQLLLALGLLAAGAFIWALLSHLDPFSQGLFVGVFFCAVVSLLPLVLMVSGAMDGRPDDASDPEPGQPPAGWEYQTEHRRELVDGLLYEEHFTILVPKQRNAITVQQKQLTGGER